MGSSCHSHVTYVPISCHLYLLVPSLFPAHIYFHLPISTSVVFASHWQWLRLLRPVLLAGREMEQRGFRGRRDRDCSAPRVRWLCTPLRGKAEAQGTRPSRPEKKGTRPIGNSRGIAVRVGQLLSGLGKALDTFLCPLHESGLVEGKRM